MMSTAKRAKDRRIQKTQHLLREALASLIREKPYDSIAVKEILDQANVGRSTFYTHFRDKDELLVSCIHDILHCVDQPGTSASAERYETIIGFSLPVFEHIQQHMQKREATIGIKSRDIIHEHLQKVLAELIADRAREDFQRRRKTAGQISPELLVRYVASTFILVLNWWVECSRLPPKEANDVFRALILPTLAANFE
jgi:AcrR family transcriptional regulator